MDTFTTRNFKKEDIPIYCQLQENTWKDKAATKENIESRFNIFPSGISVALVNNEPIGFSTFISVNKNDIIGKSWEDITNNGKCDTHNPNGNILFGADLTFKEGYAKYMALFDLVMFKKLVLFEKEAFVWGGRMPDYHLHSEEYDVESYSQAKNPDGSYLDSQINFYSKVIGVEILGVVENYFQDKESLDYGLILQVKNPFFKNKVISKIAAKNSERVLDLTIKGHNFKQKIKNF